MTDSKRILSGSFWGSSHAQRIAFLRDYLTDHEKRMIGYRDTRSASFIAIEQRCADEARQLLQQIESNESWRPPGVKRLPRVRRRQAPMNDHRREAIITEIENGMTVVFCDDETYAKIRLLLPDDALCYPLVDDFGGPSTFATTPNKPTDSPNSAENATPRRARCPPRSLPTPATT